MDKACVPVDLLLDPTLTASAKAVWMTLRLHPELTEARRSPRGTSHRPSPTRLAELTGLSCPTACKPLIGLAAAGWYRVSLEHWDSFGVAQRLSSSRMMPRRAPL